MTETEKIKNGEEAALGIIWSVGSGARKPVGFLGPAHDESWSAGWHIILLIKAWMVGRKAGRRRSLQGLQQTVNLPQSLFPGI